MTDGIKINGIRYSCSEKAALLTEDGAGVFCIITNISRGGLCAALVGSSKTPKFQCIEMKVKRGSFFCDIVNRREGVLHCKFENPILPPLFFGISNNLEESFPILER